MGDASSRYLNRELTWLEHTQRLLEEAADSSVPLLQRLKNVALTSARLDEFFAIRVASLKVLADQGWGRTDLSGLTPAEQLDAIGQRVARMTAAQYVCLADIEQEMAQAGIRRLGMHELSQRQLQVLEQTFASEITSILTPQSVPGPTELPPLANLVLAVCVRLRGARAAAEERFVVIPFGNAARRFLTLYSEGGYAYVLLEDVLGLFADRLFPGEDIVECVPFRVTRNADPDLRADLAGDLLGDLPATASDLPEQECVRLEIDQRAGGVTREFLLAAVKLGDKNLILAPGPLELAAFAQLAGIIGFEELKCEAWPPQPSPEVDLTASLFDTITQGDVLAYHPYESYDPVIRLIQEAAEDPDVLAIKQTLYGTDGDSPIVDALKRAAENNKYVTVIIELKPHQGNAYKVEWAKEMEQASVQVIYGVRGLRTHAKLCVIVRREPNGIQRYVHFGTGDYNQEAARQSTDVSLLTCDPELGADATLFFNSITSNAYSQNYHKIHAAPIGLRETLLEMIESEIQWKKEGARAFVAAKLNALGDQQIIDQLYRASQAGVKVHLNICGLCCLRPGVKGLSENIRVVSIVDRFHEHARIIHFHHGGNDRVFISSADWMPRNLDRRVELLVPIQVPAHRRRLVSVLETCFRDNVKAAELQPDGTYTRRRPGRGKLPVRSQQVLYQAAVDAVRKAEQSRRTVFQPHRAPGAGI